MTSDLISRSALIAEYCDGCDYPAKGLCDHDVCGFVTMIKEAPAVDAVEVCRCKDCKHSYKGSPHGLMCECPVGGQNTSLLGGDDFCSNGERRVDNDH